MRGTNFAILTALSLSLGGILFGCTSSSQTGNMNADKALVAFNEMVKQFPEKKGFHKILQHWNFRMPSGELFEWSKDTSANVADYAIVLMSDEFVAAGLDLEKMDKEQWLVKPAEVEDGKQLPNRLIKPYNISEKNETSDGSEDALRRLFKQKPDIINYNGTTDTYKLTLGEGVEVLWSQSLSKGDYDIAFVFDAKPFVNAGLDLNKIQNNGWVVDGKNANDSSSSESANATIMKKFKLK